MTEEEAHRREWMSDDQWACAIMLADLFRGFHHIHGKIKECGQTGILVNATNNSFASYDFDTLTRATIMAHDRLIRFSIQPSGPRMLKLVLHKRHKREGAMHERHPTIEDAIKAIRGEPRKDRFGPQRKERQMNKIEMLKELMALLGDDAPMQAGIASSMVGKYVIIRSRNEGINAGVVAAADATGVLLSDARRIWYHRPKVKTESWYEGVANHGLSDDSKVSATVAQKAILEDYSMTLCSDSARQSIETAVPHAQS